MPLLLRSRARPAPNHADGSLSRTMGTRSVKFEATTYHPHTGSKTNISHPATRLSPFHGKFSLKELPPYDVTFPKRPKVWSPGSPQYALLRVKAVFSHSSKLVWRPDFGRRGGERGAIRAAFRTSKFGRQELWRPKSGRGCVYLPRRAFEGAPTRN